jgi:hypothetical protein
MKPAVGAWIALIFFATFAVLGAFALWRAVIEPQLAGIGIIQTQTVQVQPPPQGGTQVFFNQVGGTVTLTPQVIWAKDNTVISSPTLSATAYTANDFLLSTLAFGSPTSFSWQPSQGNIKILVLYTGNDLWVLPERIQQASPLVSQVAFQDLNRDGRNDIVLVIDVNRPPFTNPVISVAEVRGTLNIIAAKADNTLDIGGSATSMNLTISTTERRSYISGMSIIGWDGEGYAAKLLYAKLTFPSDAQMSYLDPMNSYIVVESLTIGGRTFMAGQPNLATREVMFDTGSVPGQPVTSGHLFYYERGLPPEWLGIAIRFTAQYPSTGVNITPTLVLTFVRPDGTTFTVSQTLSWAS